MSKYKGQRVSGTLRRLAESLIECGIPEREVYRCVLYFDKYGMWQWEVLGPMSFDTPSCGDLDCIEPQHQIIILP